MKMFQCGGMLTPPIFCCSCVRKSTLVLAEYVEYQSFTLSCPASFGTLLLSVNGRRSAILFANIGSPSLPGYDLKSVKEANNPRARPNGKRKKSLLIWEYLSGKFEDR